MAEPSWRERRYAPLIVFALVFCAASFLLRIVFANSGGDHQALGAGELASSFALGLYFDLAAYTYATEVRDGYQRIHYSQLQLVNDEKGTPRLPNGCRETAPSIPAPISAI